MLVEIRGVAGPGADALGDGVCAHGRLAAVRTLPRERSWLAPGARAVEAVTFAPARDLGHPVEPIAWVGGRSLNRYRPGTEPSPALAGLALVLDAGASLEFAPVDLPLDEHGAPAPLDLVVTLARTHTSGPAQLKIWSGEVGVAEIDVPPDRPRSWVAPPVSWQPTHARARIRVELRAAPDSADGGSVELRDLALFRRSETIQSDLR